MHPFKDALITKFSPSLPGPGSHLRDLAPTPICFPGQELWASIMGWGKGQIFSAGGPPGMAAFPRDLLSGDSLWSSFGSAFTMRSHHPSLALKVDHTSHSYHLQVWPPHPYVPQGSVLKSFQSPPIPQGNFCPLAPCTPPLMICLESQPLLFCSDPQKPSGACLSLSIT